MRTQSTLLVVIATIQMAFACDTGCGGGCSGCASTPGSADALSLGHCSCDNSCSHFGCGDCFDIGLCHNDCGCHDNCVGNLGGLGACGIDAIYPELLNDNLGTCICIGDNAFTDCCSCLTCGTSGTESDTFTQVGHAEKLIPAITIKEDISQFAEKEICQEARYELNLENECFYDLEGSLTKTAHISNDGSTEQHNGLYAEGSAYTHCDQFGNKDACCGDCDCGAGGCGHCGCLIGCSQTGCDEDACRDPNEIILNEVNREIKQEISDLINDALSEAIKAAIHPVDLNRY